MTPLRRPRVYTLKEMRRDWACSKAFFPYGSENYEQCSGRLKFCDKLIEEYGPEADAFAAWGDWIKDRHEVIEEKTDD